MSVEKVLTKVIIISALAFFLTGCGSYSSAALESKQQSAGAELPEWLLLSYRANGTTTMDEDFEVYQMDESEVTSEMNDADENDDMLESESSKPSTLSDGSAGPKQSEQKASTPTVPQQNVGSTWYDLQTSGKSSSDSDGGFQYDVEIVTDD